jgi:hypothetical protein
MYPGGIFKIIIFIYLCTPESHAANVMHAVVRQVKIRPFQPMRSLPENISILKSTYQIWPVS